jgi:mono/diheme cytochrome c family protein
MLRRCLLPAALCVAVLLASRPAATQTVAEYYEDNCAGCHTIGEGNINGGPDLNGVTRRRDRDWLIRFILDPDDFASDPLVIQLIKDADGLEMAETEGLTRQMAEALLVLIEQRSTAGAGPEAASAAAPADPPFTPADIARGRDLFIGRIPLSRAGPACVHCHDAAILSGPGGGRMAPDLTQVHARLGGARGMGGWLRTTPTPMMRAMYDSSSLSAEESRALVAFFEDTARHAEAPARARLLPFLAGGMAMTVTILGVIGFSGRRRFRGVRSDLVAQRTGRGTEPGGSR